MGAPTTERLPPALPAGTSASVVSLTITRRAGTEVLVGVRSPETNLTHPNTVSVPTQRIPAGLAEVLVSVPPALGLRTHDAARFTAEAVLARKVGLAETLERGSFVYEVRVADVHHGAAHYANLEDSYPSESISMVSLHLTVDSGDDLVPSETASYSPLAWFPVDRFIAAARERDALALLPDGDPFELCIHGMCVDAALALLTSSSPSRQGPEHLHVPV